MTVFQIKRTPTPGNSPPPNSLFEGELAVDMAEPVAPRLWVGVPASIDPTGMRLVSDMSQSAGGGDYVNTPGTQAWNLSVDDPGSFIITDASNDKVRFQIDPWVSDVTPDPLKLLHDGSLSLGEKSSLYFLGPTAVVGNPLLAAPAGPLVYADWTYMVYRGYAAAAAYTFSWRTHDNNQPMYLETYMDTSTSTQPDKLQLRGLLYVEPSQRTNMADNDATIRLGKFGSDIWDLITQSPSSNIPGTFTIADAYSGNRRVNIYPMRGVPVAPIELLATGELLLALDPTSPMGAATKQYVDALSAGGGAFVPLDGSVPMTGGLTIDSTVSGGNSYILLTAARATGPGTWAIYNYDQSALQAGRFLDQ